MVDGYDTDRYCFSDRIDCGGPNGELFKPGAGEKGGDFYFFDCGLNVEDRGPVEGYPDKLWPWDDDHS